MSPTNRRRHAAFAPRILTGLLALGSAWAALGTASALASEGDYPSYAIACVQQELNDLGFDAGLVDGILGDRTFFAGEAYIQYTAAGAQAGWSQPSINFLNADSWCQWVANSNPEVAVYFEQFQTLAVPSSTIPVSRPVTSRSDDPSNLAERAFNLAYRFDVGDGVQKNESLAVYWYLKAAGLGYAPAERNLGGMYGSGRGTSQNDALAIYWFQKAAEQGDAQAEYVMGKYYSASPDVVIDWLSKAAAQGHELAIAELEVRLGIN